MLKQYVFIPKKSKMSPGKIASQSCHATFMALEKECDYNLKKWKTSGMCVIVLEADDSNHLMQISKYCDQWNVPHHVYIDEGHTEVLPLSATALATGIVEDDKQWMFEKFQLYGAKK